MAPQTLALLKGWAGGVERYETIGSNEQLRGMYNLTCAMNTLTLVLVHIASPRSLREEQHSNILVNVLLEADWASVIEKLDLADVCPSSL